MLVAAGCCLGFPSLQLRVDYGFLPRCPRATPVGVPAWICNAGVHLVRGLHLPAACTHARLGCQLLLPLEFTLPHLPCHLALRLVGSTDLPFLYRPVAVWTRRCCPLPCRSPPACRLLDALLRIAHPGLRILTRCPVPFGAGLVHRATLDLRWVS